jgi:hypothetical protein
MQNNNRNSAVNAPAAPVRDSSATTGGGKPGNIAEKPLKVSGTLSVVTPEKNNAVSSAAGFFGRANAMKQANVGGLSKGNPERECPITGFVKQKDDSWSYREVNELPAVLSLSSVGCVLGLNEVYDGVQFPAAPSLNVQSPETP